MTQIFLLDAHTMGVPQRRRRVFFIAHRNDLDLPKLKLDFHEKPIRSGKCGANTGFPTESADDGIGGKKEERGYLLADISLGNAENFPCSTMPLWKTAGWRRTNTACAIVTRFCDGENIPSMIMWRHRRFREDYDFMDQEVNYVCGMSVPPVMMANIASEVYRQWLKYV